MLILGKDCKQVIVYAEPNKDLRNVIMLGHETFFPDLEAKFFENKTECVSYLHSFNEPILSTLDKRDCLLAIVLNHWFTDGWGNDILEEFARKSEFSNIPFYLFYSKEEPLLKHTPGKLALKNGARAYVFKEQGSKLFKVLRREIYGRK